MTSLDCYWHYVKSGSRQGSSKVGCKHAIYKVSMMCVSYMMSTPGEGAMQVSQNVA